MAGALKYKRPFNYLQSSDAPVPSSKEKLECNDVAIRAHN